MVEAITPIRSIANVRADDLTAVEAALTIGLDAIYLDLEEPRTPLSEADRAVIRKSAGAWLAARPRGGPTRIFARVQSIGSGQTLRDLEAIAVPALAGVLLPKVSDASAIWAADALLTAVEEDHGLAAGSLLVYPILETAQSLRRAFEIAAASPRVAYMGGAVSKFGDIVQALGYRWTRSGRESLIFRSSALLDCLAGGVLYPVTGGSSQPAGDEDSVRRWAVEGRSLGYWGSQIRALASHVAIVNEVFSPTDEEIAGWRQILARHDPSHRLSSDLDAQPAAVRAAVGRARAALEWADSLARRR